MSLAVNNLTIMRGQRIIQQGLTFSLEPGRALILRGPNGVGKTTLLRAMAGFIPATAGEITFGGGDEDITLNTAYFAHADGIKPQLTVAENIKFWADLYGGGDPADALASFDLTALSDRLAANCSAGQKRRLGLARLLVANRRLWLLDEPTVSLDAENRDRLAHVLREHLDKDGMAIIATHDPDLIEAETLTLTLPNQSAAANPFLESEFA